MKNRLIYIGLLIFAIAFVISCAKSDDDTGYPVIHYIKMGTRDTINIAPNDTILLNVTENTPDTLILNHALYFEGHFSDNERLSTYMIYLDTVPTNLGVKGDTVYTYKIRKSTISGKSDVIDSHRTIIFPDSLSYTTKDAEGKTVTKKRPIREGQYKIKVELADEAWNVTKDSVVVYLFHRKTIVDNRSAWGY